MVAGVPRIASVKPTPAIRVRILRRLTMHVAALDCEDLKRVKVRMTDNNGITIHHVDT